VFRGGHHSVRVEHVGGVEGARSARGVAVVIDVLRAFTVSAYALAGGATECRLVETVEEAVELGRRLPRAVVSCEVDGLPVPGVPISNSPTMIRDTDLRGRVLVQRTTSGVQAALAATACDRVIAGALVTVSATARLVRALRPATVTLVATAAPLGHPEDRACADLLEALLLDRPPPPLAGLLAPLRSSERYRRLRAGLQPGFPASDLDLALAVDTFDFAMPVEGGEGALRVVPLRVDA
jgi:2-phosphosulfolactate phosphatase